MPCALLSVGQAAAAAVCWDCCVCCCGWGTCGCAVVGGVEEDSSERCLAVVVGIDADGGVGTAAGVGTVVDTAAGVAGGTVVGGGVLQCGGCQSR